MRKICVWLVLLFLFGCTHEKYNDYDEMTIKCEKKVVINDEDSEMYGGSYITGYVVIDGELNRIVHVREYMRDSFSSNEEYENYMKFLQDSYLLNEYLSPSKSSIMPYYESDRIVYPYLILDYTDLGKYTEDEVPTQVRTEDGKSIDFDLYWDYIQQNGVLDGFHCTLAK